MHDKNKDTKSFTELRKYLLNGYFFDSIGNSQIYNPIKSLWGSFFCKNNLLLVALDGLIFIWKIEKGKL